MVEWKKLGEVCEIGTGSNNREDACDNGCYPFYVRSQEVLKIDSYSYDEEAILIPGEGGIGDIFHYINGKYGLHQRTYRVHPITDDVKGRYIYYFLFANFKTYINAKSYKSTAASIRKPMLLDFPIPIPSLEEQARIVGILDTFTSAIDNLKEQIAQRRKQYEYYRDQLLDLEGKEGVEMKMLGEIAFIKTGIKPQEILDRGQYKYINAGTTESGFANAYNCEGDVVTTPSRGQGGIGYVGYQAIPFWLGPLCYQIKSNVKSLVNKFLYYYLLSHNEEILKYKSEGGTPALNAIDLKKILIPVLHLQEQNRIVSILDTFEESIQNLEKQLEQRQKQYEYYRNKLLTFE